MRLFRKQVIGEQIINEAEEEPVSELLPPVPAGWRWRAGESTYDLQKLIGKRWVEINFITFQTLYNLSDRPRRIAQIMSNTDFDSDSAVEVVDPFDDNIVYTRDPYDPEMDRRPGELIPQCDPELERLLAEEEEIERRVHEGDPNPERWQGPDR